MGAPRGNHNRTRHALRAATLPPSCKYIENAIRTFRRYVFDLLVEQSGGADPSFTAQAVLQSACRHEQRALLCARWLRIDHDTLSATERVAIARDISNATTARDAALKQLGLDAGQKSAIELFFSQRPEPEPLPDPEPAEPAVQAEPAPDAEYAHRFAADAKHEIERANRSTGA